MGYLRLLVLAFCGFTVGWVAPIAFGPDEQLPRLQVWELASLEDFVAIDSSETVHGWVDVLERSSGGVLVLAPNCTVRIADVERWLNQMQPVVTGGIGTILVRGVEEGAAAAMIEDLRSLNAGAELLTLPEDPGLSSDGFRYPTLLLRDGKKTTKAYLGAETISQLAAGVKN